MSFDELLKDLEELQSLKKSAPVDDLSDDEDDDKIATAADDDGEEAQDETDEDEAVAADDAEDADAVEGDADDEEDDEEDDADEEEGDDEQFGKSFRLKTADGDVIEAVDGVSLIKSLTQRLDAQEDKFSGVLSQMVDLIKSQQAQIEKLNKSLNRLAGAGRGRKAVLSVVEKPDPAGMAKSQSPGMSADEFMNKALEAQREGRITSVDVAMAETALMKGMPVPESVVKKVLS